MTVWSDLTGQSAAIEVFRAAAESSLRPRTQPQGEQHEQGEQHKQGVQATDARGPADSMTHSWLITGPPGSGRSNLAYAFASALLCRFGGCGVCPDCTQVAARTHPDLAVLATERVIISIDEVRKLVSSSQFSPSVARYRVVVIEDADRMQERTSNVLLKALEEPPERTVWILCAPSEADLLPTIRSRVRSVRLRVPSTDDVASLLQRRDGVDAVTAERAARESQSHIGMAHRLATNDDARARRAETLDLALGIRSVGDAVRGAARLLEIAGADAQAITEERDAEERAHALRSLGVEPGQAVPPALRGQMKALEDDQKRRATRSLRDGIDRILTDLLSLYRDIVLVQLGAPESVELVNEAIADRVREVAAGVDPTQTLAAMDAIADARRRIAANVAPALSLEAMLITLAEAGRTAARKVSP
ncbi:DNA polymerase III subunit delta' [Herbiconiux flava]|uniref:DNA polymerase-3 subunit delta n=1 Tax=Herbiconiux flava TaxID=881268 RepID=A0A852STW2_9MICO|nr:DNA polymerase III subunit delta' [Herbiconiux flava]NYD72446.1 DNA polymerase-3 subunit delta' [Herbiconiux flava]GLK15556.1 DNA polymerase III subunit delta' [Herbiconiux flava]